MVGAIDCAGNAGEPTCGITVQDDDWITVCRWLEDHGFEVILVETDIGQITIQLNIGKETTGEP